MDCEKLDNYIKYAFYTIQGCSGSIVPNPVSMSAETNAKKDELKAETWIRERLTVKLLEQAFCH